MVSVAALSLQTQPPTPAEAMVASIQSADSTRRPTIRIELTGSLFKSLGFAKGATGTLSLGGNAGTATGTLSAALSGEPGALVFSTAAADPELELRVWPSSGVAVPRYQARGHTVKVIRAANGVLAVQSIR
jgi:hypothetical protein